VGADGIDAEAPQMARYFSAKSFLGKAEHFGARAFRAPRLLYDKGIARRRLNV
jgi:hypothetical protein